MSQTPYFTEDMYEMVAKHNKIVELMDEETKEKCSLSHSDSYEEVKKKCGHAYSRGGYYLPLVTKVLGFNNDPDQDDKPPMSTLQPADSDEDSADAFSEEMVTEEKSSTSRVRKYYKKHPEKVKQYLRKTVDDRSQRNKDRAAAVEKHGEKKMANHDVHHPDGPDGGHWRLAKKDHGPDKKADKKKKKSAPKTTPSKKKAPTPKKKAPTPKKKPTPKKAAPSKKKEPTPQEKPSQPKHPYLTKLLQNPKTAKDVLLASALSYPKDHPLYKAAVEFIRLLLLAYPEKHPLHQIADKLTSQPE